MRGRLDNQVIVVTGGSRGIGAAISRALIDDGATVVATYQSRKEDAETLATEMDGRLIVRRVDIRDHKENADLIQEVAATYGRLDGLILNAGVWRGNPIERLDLHDWELVLSTGLTGAFSMAQAALPEMVKASYGRIVLISSIIGLIGHPGDTAYATTKAGMFGFVKSLAKEVGRHGVTVNAIAPGLIETEMVAGIPDTSMSKLLKRASIRRLGKPEEVAAAVRFLLNDGAYVTGHTLVVDGGLSL